MNVEDLVQVKIQEAARKTEAARKRRADRDTARQAGVEQRHRAKLAHLAAADTAAVARIRERIRYVLGKTGEQVAAEYGVPLEWATGYADAARDFAAELDGPTTVTGSRNAAPEAAAPDTDVPPESSRRRLAHARVGNTEGDQ